MYANTSVATVRELRDLLRIQCKLVKFYAAIGESENERIAQGRVDAIAAALSRLAPDLRMAA